MSSILNHYFDKVFVVNMKSRPDRMNLMHRRLKFFDIDYERVDAISGRSLNGIYQTYLKNTYYENSNYLGANLTHLNIYAQSIDLGFKNILILEDDVRIHRDIETKFNKLLNSNSLLNSDPCDILYLAYIPLTDDRTRWSYSILDESFFVSDTLVKPKNFWSLMAYGINSNFMQYVLDHYSRTFEKELDRFFVEDVQPNSEFTVYGSSPQLFASDNGYSDNDGFDHSNLLLKSVDRRFSELHDYV